MRSQTGAGSQCNGVRGREDGKVRGRTGVSFVVLAGAPSGLRLVVISDAFSRRSLAAADDIPFCLTQPCRSPRLAASSQRGSSNDRYQGLLSGLGATPHEVRALLARTAAICAEGYKAK